MSDISNSDKVIDSRDVIARIEELESEQESLQDDVQTAQDAFEELDEDADEETRQSTQDAIDEAQQAACDFDGAEELAALRSLAEEAEGYCPDWIHGATLIRDSYFESYARELAEDIGAVKAGASWPNNCIDWEQAASELQQDYTSVDFDGVTYWVR